MNPVAELPRPDPDAQALSAALESRIRAEIRTGGGAISFARYMELCLYEPGLGYYSAGQRKFGTGGDFVTAPELGNLFARCIARSCAAVLEAPGGGDILEFGAGSGRLAVDLLAELDSLGILPERYLILERSGDLRERQQVYVQQQLPHLFERVHWLEQLPGPGFRGVMLGNEVLDAMAVERFRWNGVAAEQYGVTESAAGLDWITRPLAGDAADRIAQIAREQHWPAPYTSELNTELPAWLASVADRLENGLMLFIDYGYPRREYYHVQRVCGTLQCHYRQRVHDDPLLWPGLQDITAHVDFTALAEAAVSAGLAVSGYTTQAHYLIDCGIDRLLHEQDPGSGVDYLRQAQQAKMLLLPGEMGERFQCMALTRDLDVPVPGFRGMDMRFRL